jgi:hypothetical protein
MLWFGLMKNQWVSSSAFEWALLLEYLAAELALTWALMMAQKSVGIGWALVFLLY